MEEGKPFNPEHITELSKTSNRGFFPGFLIQNPEEKAMEYEKRNTMQTHEFVGIIRGIEERDHRKLYKMEVKGRLDAPEEVEVMAPEKDFKVELKAFINPFGEILTTVHPGQKDQVLIELPEEAEIGTIIRKKRI